MNALEHFDKLYGHLPPDDDAMWTFVSGWNSAMSEAMQRVNAMPFGNDTRASFAIYFQQMMLVNPDDVKPTPVQEPVAFNAGVPPLYPEMKDGETISVEYTTPPAQPAPVQEPVFCEYCGGNDDADFGLPTDHCTDCARPQPAAQRQWVGLTDEEMDDIYEKHHNQYGECESPNFGYERAIEAKLKEKNT
jgi:hypothetical protein